MKKYFEILMDESGGDSGGEGGGGGSLLTGGEGGGDDTSNNGDGGDPSGNEGEGDVTSKPYWMGLYGEDGKINKDNLDNLPEHLRDSKDTFAKYDTVDSLLGGLRNASQLAGKKGLEPLPEGATEEMIAERGKLMQRLNNVPESPDGYGFTKPEDFPENVPWNEERTGNYAAILHKHNASPELAKELFDAQMADTASEMEGFEAKQAEVLEGERTKLKQEFGNDFQASIQKAVKGISAMGLMDGENAVDANHPIFKTAIGVKMAKAYADAIGEDNLVTGGNDGPSGMGPREKALDIINNPQNPLYKAFHEPDHPQHDHAVRTRSNFNKLHHASKK